MAGWLAGITRSAEGFAGEAGAVSVLMSGERGCNDGLSCPRYAMEGLAAGCSAAFVPHSDAAGWNALRGSCVE